MGKFIVRLDTDQGPRYAVWSSIVDAPVTYGMTRDKFERWYRREHGREGAEELVARLERADGPSRCSALDGETLAGLVLVNRCRDYEGFPKDRDCDLADIVAAICRGCKLAEGAPNHKPAKDDE